MDLFLASSQFFDQHYFSSLIVGCAVALYFSKNRKALFLAMLFLTLLLPVAKDVYREDRPCKAAMAIPECAEYGFPSGHASSSMLLAAGTLGSAAFFFFLPMAVYISAGRVYIGVHSPAQVAGGMALGIIMFFVFESLVHAFRGGRRRRQRIGYLNEFPRQLAHIVIAVAVIAGAVVAGKALTLEALFGIVAVGIVLVNVKLMGWKIPVVDALLRKFERKDAVFPGRGALLYFVGLAFLLSFARPLEFALAGIAFIGIGDGASTLVGTRFGKTKLPWNREKSFEGALAFFVAGGIAAYAFIGAQAFLFAAILALVETVDWHLDDNLLIPIATVILGFMI